MPFTDGARALMLEFVWHDIRAVGLSDDETIVEGLSPDEIAETVPVSFGMPTGGDTFITNNAEVIFPRSSADGTRPLAFWFIIDERGDVLAFDKLERPILLRKGERATFPPGALKLELK